MNLRSSVEQRAWLERDAGRGQPVARQDQHVDSGSSSDRFSGRTLGLAIGQKRARAIRHAFHNHKTPGEADVLLAELCAAL